MKRDGMEVFVEALVTGDTERAILNQEARGQRDLVNSDVLPKECNYCTHEQIEQMGIVFGDDVDELFVRVQLPPGWKKVPTDHSMWSELVDEQGRKRASIFYKAAWYDRSAHITLERRYHYVVEPVLGWSHPDYRKGQWHCVVKDAGKIIWASAPLRPEPDYNEDRNEWLRWDDEKERLGKQGDRWLQEHYPDWLDPLAYW